MIRREYEVRIEELVVDGLANIDELEYGVAVRAGIVDALTTDRDAIGNARGVMAGSVESLSLVAPNPAGTSVGQVVASALSTANGAMSLRTGRINDASFVGSRSRGAASSNVTRTLAGIEEVDPV